MSKRKLAALAAAAGLAVTMLSPAPAHAAVNVVVAVPGSGIAGYATPVVVLSKAAPAQLINADAITSPHDVRSRAKDSNDRPWISSAVIGPGVTEININPNTPPGEYEFFCVVHASSMTGTAYVQ